MKRNALAPLAACLLFGLGCTSTEPASSGTPQPAAPSQSSPLGASGATPPSSGAPVAPTAAATATSSAAAAPTHAPDSVSPPPTPTPNVVLPQESGGNPVVAFRPNGRMFAAGLGKKVSLFPVEGGEPRPLPDHDRPVLALIFSWKGDRLATVEEGGKVRVWDPSSGKLIAELPDAITAEVHAVVFAPDGKLLAGAGSSATIWDVDKKKKVCSTAETWAFDIAFTLDQGSLVTTGNGSMTRWDTATCAKKAEGEAQTGGTFGSWAAPNGKYVSAAAPDGHGLSVYDGRSFKGIEVLAKSFGCRDHVGPARFSRDGEILLATGSFQWFRSIRMDSLKTIAAYDIPKPDEVSQLVMFDEGERLLVIRGEKGELVSAVSKAVLYSIELKDARTFDLGWDRKHLLGASQDTAHVWETATGKLVKSSPLPR